MSSARTRAIDTLIRKYGYCGTPATLASGEGRSGSGGEPERGGAPDSWVERGAVYDSLLSRASDAEGDRGAHFEYGDLAEYTAKYDVTTLTDGWNVVDGEEIFFISNPGLGLWAYRRPLSWIR